MQSFARFAACRYRYTLLAVWPLLLGAGAGCQRESAGTPELEQTGTLAARGAVATSSTSSNHRARSSERATTRLAETPAPSVSGDAKQTPATNVATVGSSMPEVLMSADHAATCRVNVGDLFPNLTLTAFDGGPASLESQLGQRLTIVVFWSVGQPMSVEQIRRLQREFASPYQAAGVRVVAVNVGNSAEDARSVLANVTGDFVNLHDPDGTAFAEVATTIVPRTYLLRSDRQIVWFDLEYSRSTFRELHSAIRYVLQQHERQANQDSRSLM